MSKMIQIRNVPDAWHRHLKARAAVAGMSLSDYLLSRIRGIAEPPTLAEFRERLHKPISQFRFCCTCGSSVFLMSLCRRRMTAFPYDLPAFRLGRPTIEFSPSESV